MTNANKVECLRCAALPATLLELIERGLPDGSPRRPAVLRKIDPRSTPRRPYCVSHWREVNAERRQADSDKRSRWRSGVDEETRQEVLAEQGGRCPCGAGLGGKRLNLSADHDHKLAAMHDHPEDVACLRCLVGFLCHHCNREIVGYLCRAGRTGNASRNRYEVADALESLATYLRNPPAARVHARRFAS